MKIRLQKFLADAGIASRRASEEIIVSGRVTVNGDVVRELGSKVDPAADEIAVDRRPVKVRRKIYIALNKPPGVVCSKSDPHIRKTVGDLLPKEWAHLSTVGRLDFNSEGLIFITNDGQFSLQLTHPRYGIRKKYLVTVEGRVEMPQLAPMLDGIYHEGEKLKAERARILRSSNAHTLIEVELAEGKNREIRRMFESQRLTIERLQRVQIGPIKLGELPLGKWRALTPAEIKALLSSTQKDVLSASADVREGSRTGPRS